MLQVTGYVYGNCVHCHNGTKVFDLSPTAFANVVNQPGRRGGTLVVPGRPEESLLFEMFSSGAMPPLGVQRRDRVAVELIKKWIEELR